MIMHARASIMGDIMAALLMCLCKWIPHTHSFQPQNFYLWHPLSRSIFLSIPYNHPHSLMPALPPPPNIISECNKLFPPFFSPFPYLKIGEDPSPNDHAKFKIGTVMDWWGWGTNVYRRRRLGIGFVPYLGSCPMFSFSSRVFVFVPLFVFVACSGYGSMSFVSWLRDKYGVISTLDIIGIRIGGYDGLGVESFASLCHWSHSEACLGALDKDPLEFERVR